VQNVKSLDLQAVLDRRRREACFEQLATRNDAALLLGDPRYLRFTASSNRLGTPQLESDPIFCVSGRLYRPDTQNISRGIWRGVSGRLKVGHTPDYSPSKAAFSSLCHVRHTADTLPAQSGAW
jgi:hypothetical protein